MTNSTPPHKPHIPGLWETGKASDADCKMARDASRSLAGYINHEAKAPLRLHVESLGLHSGLPITIPYVAARQLQFLLDEMGHHGAVHVLPVSAELTTQQAAELLRVSRPHVVRLMKSGALPHRLVGSHRRVTLKDLVEYDLDQTEPWWRHLRRNPKPASTLDLLAEAESVLASAPASKPSPFSKPSPSSSSAPTSNPTPSQTPSSPPTTPSAPPSASSP